MTSHHRRARRLSFACLGSALALALSGGCTPEEQIASYETPQVQARAVAVDPDKVRAILDHMFAAVVPAGQQAWFFKLVVKGAEAADLREPFDKFLATVDVSKMVDVDGDKKDDHPEWTLLEGWTEEPGNTMRAATIVIPHGDKKLEITVSSLPLAGEWPAYLKVNVDRWMKQLQQPPLDGATIEKLARSVDTADGKATVFELVGTMQSAPMGAAMAGMPQGHPPISERTPADSAGPQAAPAAGPSSSAAGANEKLAYKAPDAWQALPLGGGMFPREASFKITADGSEAELAVTKFAATGQMADLGANVRRWAAQVSVTNLSDDDVVKAAHEITLASEPALRFEFSSPAGKQPPSGIVAVMAKRGEMVWFFKLSGAKAVVDAQRDAFDAFLKSVRFDEAS